MSVEVEIALSAHDIPVLATLDVRVSLRNTGALPLELPGADDTSDALTFDVYRRGTDILVRRMNGLTRQALRSRARLDSSNALEIVPGGAALTFTLDLAKYHQPLRTGEYEVQATYAYEPASVMAVSARVPLRVTDLGITGVSAYRDNPVLDGIAVLVEAEDGSVWGRLQNPRRPIAGWWNRPLSLPPGTRGAFAATAGFFQTDSFAPRYETWVLFVHGQYLVARHFGNGIASGRQHAAPLPPYGRLLRSAVRTRAGELLAFFWSDGLLEGYRVDPSALVKVMETPLPKGLRGEPCVRADDAPSAWNVGSLASAPAAGAAPQTVLHIVYPDRGLVHKRVAGSGQSSEERIHKTGLLPFQWSYEPSDRRVKGVFIDSPRGRALTLVTSDPNGRHVVETQLPSRGHVVELQFDRTQEGQTHILYTTSRGRLYLVIGDRAPALLATGRERYFPVLLADTPTYVGFVKPGEGHRFHAYTLKRWHPHLMDYETRVPG